MKSLEPGHQIAGYRVEHELGRGGMGVVYSAVNIQLNKRVALKLLHLPFVEEDDHRVRRFLNEGIAAARVRHPAIIEVFDAGIEDGLPWMALEELEGESLHELMTRAGPLTPDEAVYVAIGVLEGLAAAHAHDIIHRDIKPANIFLTRGDTIGVKILDFGVAKLVDADDASMRMTRTEAILGTPFYLSPEQAESATRVTPATDIYALGVTLFEMLSGELPYEAEGFGALMRRLFTEPPLELEVAAPDLPEGLAPLVMTCLDHDPLKRLPAEALAGALRRCVPEPHMSPDRVQLHAPGLSVGTLETMAPGDSGDFETLSPRVLEDTLGHDELAQTSEATHELPPEPPASDEVEHQTTPAPPSEDSTARPPGSRRAMLFAAAAALLVVGLGLAWWWGAREPEGGAEEATALEGPSVRFGFLPAIDPEIILSEAEPLRVYLEERLGRPVTFVMTEGYADAVERLRTDALEFSMVAPLSFVQIMDSLGTLTPIAAREFDGVIEDEPIAVVRRDSDIEGWEGMRGRSFCLISPNSSTGYLLPRQQIRTLGYDPDRFIGDIHWSGAHHQALRDLLDGRCEVAHTYTGAWQAADQAGIQVMRLRTIRTAGSVPHNIVVASGAASPELQREMSQALLDFDPQAVVGERVLGEVRRLSGFRPPSMTYYETLQNAWRAERHHPITRALTRSALNGGLATP